MKPRIGVYRLEVFYDKHGDPEFSLESNSPFQHFAVGDFVKSENVAGFGNATFHGKVIHVAHHIYAVEPESYVHAVLVYLEKSDWWDKGPSSW
jgi:hypothetical protein